MPSSLLIVSVRRRPIFAVLLLAALPLCDSGCVMIVRRSIKALRSAHADKTTTPNPTATAPSKPTPADAPTSSEAAGPAASPAIDATHSP